MISYLPILQESNLYLPDSKDLIFFVEIEDFMIDRKRRGIGVGKMLLRWVEWQALQFHCDHIIGTLLTKRQESQKIFAREKFILEGFLFKK